jgi:hypothetical protein
MRTLFDEKLNTAVVVIHPDDFAAPENNELIEPNALEASRLVMRERILKIAERRGLSPRATLFVASFIPVGRVSDEALRTFIEGKLSDLEATTRILDVTDDGRDPRAPTAGEDLARAENNELLVADIDVDPAPESPEHADEESHEDIDVELTIESPEDEDGEELAEDLEL